MFLFLAFMFLVLVSYLCTFFLRRYAISSSLIDVPNDRSSHTVPTPRGGGVAIVVTFLACTVALSLFGFIDVPTLVALLGAGTGIAVLGFLDDHGHIDARWRLLGHFAAAAWGLYWIPGLPVLSMYGYNITTVWLITPFAVLYLVWLLNLYNFMDGIDGLASIEAISICLCVGLIYWSVGLPNQLLLPPILLASAVSGFLIWNFPPAKIFMGDAGSGFLGIILGLLSIQGAVLSPRFLWVWLILLGVFIVDATFTLLRRIANGKKPYEAHRSHGYQRASRTFGAHLPVTISIGLVNVIWLMPIAYLVSISVLEGLVGLLLAYTPLTIIAYKFKAGVAD